MRVTAHFGAQEVGFWLERTRRFPLLSLPAFSLSIQLYRSSATYLISTPSPLIIARHPRSQASKRAFHTSPLSAQFSCLIGSPLVAPPTYSARHVNFHYPAQPSTPSITQQSNTHVTFRFNPPCILLPRVPNSHRLFRCPIVTFSHCFDSFSSFRYPPSAQLFFMAPVPVYH